MTAVRLYSGGSSVSGVQQQSARTCAAPGESSSQITKKVIWNEMFFFKVESEVCELSTLSIHVICSLTVVIALTSIFL
jgi:hypothetical protein